MHFSPTYLQSGDKVIIVAPAGKIKQGGLEVAECTLNEWGLQTTISTHALGGENYFSGTDDERLSDLQSALDSEEHSAIFCARGGYGLTRIIDQLDFSKFKNKPKWIVGFSDITALHLSLSKIGFQSVHALMPTGFGDANQRSIDSLKVMLFGEANIIETTNNLFNRKGIVTAPITGGNLSLLSSSLGTKDEIDTDGKILFIEEIDEYLYKMDRMLGQLTRSGKLKNLAGMMIGHMSKMKDTSIPFGKNIQELILHHVEDHSFPVLFDVPVGHEPLNLPVIQEGIYQLDVTNTNGGCLRLV